MKHIHTILLVSIFSICYSTAQKNTLTHDELYGIKFNNVTLGQIEDTEANTTQMQALFGGTLSSGINTSSPNLTKDFSNSAITLGFEDDNDTGDSYYLSYMSVLDESMQVTIKGITAKLGDHVSVFGDDFHFVGRPSSNTTDGALTNADTSSKPRLSYLLVFSDERFGNSAMFFEFDIHTDILIDISFTTF